MTLQPGQSLSAEDCKLLERGDWINDPLFRPFQFDGRPLQRVAVRRLTWLGRPGADGFIPWSGGGFPTKSPIPAAIDVEVRFRDGTTKRAEAGSFDWHHSPTGGWSLDIIAWRPAPSVEGLGALRATPSVPRRDVSDSADQLRAAVESAKYSLGITEKRRADDRYVTLPADHLRTILSALRVGAVPRFGDALTPDNVKLLKAGDFIADRGRRTCRFERQDAPGYIWAAIGESAMTGDLSSAFTFIARPGVWQDWSGGENPVPGMMVEVRWSTGSVHQYVDLDAALSAEAKEWRKKIGLRIIAWRPAPSVEGLGALRATPFVPTEREDGPSDRRQPFDPAFYAALRDHAMSALRERKPFSINADGALALINQAAADRAALSASGPAGVSIDAPGSENQHPRPEAGSDGQAAKVLGSAEGIK